MNDPYRPRLIIFAKAPVIGGAKSRLARDVGAVTAWRIYRAMTAGILRRTADARWTTTLAVTPDRALRHRFPDIWTEGVRRTTQGEGDLGARLARSFSAHGPSVVIGTDAPGVARADIAAAFKALRRNNLVLGPAEDGGFWLIGVRAPLRATVLAEVRWSTEHALADTRAALSHLGRPVLLRTLSDIDTGADWRAWLSRSGRRTSL